MILHLVAQTLDPGKTASGQRVTGARMEVLPVIVLLLTTRRTRSIYPEGKHVAPVVPAPQKPSSPLLSLSCCPFLGTIGQLFAWVIMEVAWCVNACSSAFESTEATQLAMYNEIWSFSTVTFSGASYYFKWCLLTAPSRNDYSSLRKQLFYVSRLSPSCFRTLSTRGTARSPDLAHQQWFAENIA
jgi:hypothetical protein